MTTTSIPSIRYPGQTSRAIDPSGQKLTEDWREWTKGIDRAVRRLLSGVNTAQDTADAAVTPTGTPASGNLAKFSGAKTITNGNLSGDATTSGTLAVTLATSGVTAASYGDATHIPSITFDAKGRATAASNNAVTIPTADGTTIKSTAGVFSVAFTPVTAPSAPASGFLLYVDSGDSNKLKAISSLGNITILANA